MISADRPYLTSLGILLPAAILVAFTAFTLARNGDYQTKILLWEATVKESPLKRRPHQSYACELSRVGRFDEALREFETALKLPDDRISRGDVYREMGTAYFGLGRYDDAISVYFKGLPYARRTDGRLFNYIALAYMKKRDYDGALAYAEKARDADPRRPRPWGTLAEIFSDKGDYDRASEYYLKAVELDPDAVFRYKNAALSLEKAGRYEEAYRFMSVYAAKAPDKDRRLQALAFMEQVREKARIAGGAGK